MLDISEEIAGKLSTTLANRVADLGGLKDLPRSCPAANTYLWLRCGRLAITCVRTQTAQW